MATRMVAFFFLCALVSSTNSISDKNLVFSRVDRIIDAQNYAIRMIWSLKVEYSGASPKNEITFALSKTFAEKVALIQAASSEGKQKSAKSYNLEIVATEPPNDFALSHNTSLFSIKLHKPLKKGEKPVIEVYCVITHLLEPFPSDILQSDLQFVLFHDSHYFLSPYAVKSQSLVFRLPGNRVESFTPLNPSRHSGQEIKFGPYENIEPFSFSPLDIHFENNQPFPVVKSLVREIEISHWGNVYVVENYHVVHAGAKLKGSFSRLDFQVRNMPTGASALRALLARLPPRARSLYYRDEIGNISTSHVRGDIRKTEMEFEPRYPLLGGWSATFTIGYSLPLQDFVFQTRQGLRMLNITFGCPLGEVIVEDITIKVALPEGSKQISASTPFPVDKHMEIKYSYLDTVGRPVIVIEKKNVVNEHSNMYYQVFYHFDGIFLLAEPLLIVSAFLALFLAFIAYVRFDFPISKSTPSYIAKVQKEEARDILHNIISVIRKRIGILEKLDSSLHALGRTGDVAAAKSVKKSVESDLKSTSADLRAAINSLEKLSNPPVVLPKVLLVVSKDKEKQEKMIQKHATVVDACEHKASGKEIDAKILPLQSKISAVHSEIKELLSLIEERI